MDRWLSKHAIPAAHAIWCAWLLAAAILLAQSFALEHEYQQHHDEVESCSVCVLADTSAHVTASIPVPAAPVGALPQQLGVPQVAATVPPRAYASRAPPHFASLVSMT